ncbi:unnamed protein product [Ixodes persulcatus]
MFLVFVRYNIWNCGHSRARAMGGNAGREVSQSEGSLARGTKE